MTEYKVGDIVTVLGWWNNMKPIECEIREVDNPLEMTEAELKLLYEGIKEHIIILTGHISYN